VLFRSIAATPYNKFLELQFAAWIEMIQTVKD